MNQIILAFNFWKEVSGGIIDYQIVYERNYIFPKHNDIFFTKEVSTENQLLAVYYKQSKLIKIMINHIDGDALFKNTIIHELGHYFGLSHSEDYYSYMFYAIDNKTSYLNKKDKEEFCRSVCCKK